MSEQFLKSTNKHKQYYKKKHEHEQTQTNKYIFWKKVFLDCYRFFKPHFHSIFPLILPIVHCTPKSMTNSYHMTIFVLQSQHWLNKSPKKILEHGILCQKMLLWFFCKEDNKTKISSSLIIYSIFFQAYQFCTLQLFHKNMLQSLEIRRHDQLHGDCSVTNSS